MCRLHRIRRQYKLYLRLCIWFVRPKYTIRSDDGRIICPLMLKHAGRFTEDVLPCDVPRTRGRNAGACARGRVCLVRERYPEETAEELDPRGSFTRPISLHFDN